MAELAFRSVSIQYGHVSAVDRVDLIVPAGRIVGLVGESGSGKSSLARAAVGLAPVSKGRICLDDVDVGRLPRRGALQMVFQDPYASLDPRMRVGATIAEAIHRTPRLSRAERRAEVSRLLERVGLDPGHAASLPGQLSGGQRQRVAFARALASRPDVIIADEITSALDASVQGAILNLVRELQAGLGLGMLFISHNISVVRYIADNIAVMHDGEIVESGPAEQILEEATHPYTRELLAAARHR
jgi:peptide/nickel transport system ATP-binding protein